MKEKIKYTSKDIRFFIISALVFALLVGSTIWIIWAYKDLDKIEEERDYNIEAIYDDVYAIYSQNISNAPAYNYEIVTIRIGNQEMTYKGYVNIIYTKGQPRVHIVKVKRIYSDEITIYIPEGSVERLSFTNSTNQ